MKSSSNATRETLKG